jgi:hypothetical protein
MSGDKAAKKAGADEGCAINLLDILGYPDVRKFNFFDTSTFFRLSQLGIRS